MINANPNLGVTEKWNLLYMNYTHDLIGVNIQPFSCML